MSRVSRGEGSVCDSLARRLSCETCGRDVPRTQSTFGGDDCPRWDCDGGPVLNQFERRARDRLREIPSDTCQRLANYIEHTYWSPSLHEFIAPLEMTEGDIVLRISDDATGYLWLYWAGTPLDRRYYKCISTLPHYQDYKVVGRRNGSPNRIASTLDEHYPRPTHIDDVPAPVRAVMANERPYPDEWGDE